MNKQDLKTMLIEMFQNGEISIEVESSYDYMDNSVNTYVSVEIDGKQIANSSDYACLPDKD